MLFRPEGFEHAGFSGFCGLKTFCKRSFLETDDVTIITWFACPSFPQTQTQNGRWLLRFEIPPASCGLETFHAFLDWNLRFQIHPGLEIINNILHYVELQSSSLQMNTLLIIYYVIYILEKRLRECCAILLLLIYAWIVLVIYASLQSLIYPFLDGKIFIPMCITWLSCWLVTCLRLDTWSWHFLRKGRTNIFGGNFQK